MSNFGKNGRLGNQLFQYASLQGIAKKYDKVLTLPPWEYAKYFQESFVDDIKMEVAPTKIKERNFHYTENEYTLDFKNNLHIDFDGYFQNEKYFESSEAIGKLFRFEHLFEGKVFNKFTKQNPDFKEGKRSLAISVRRGDFVNNPNYLQLGIDYYLGALVTHFNQYFKGNNNIVIFSDDIDWCKIHFSCLTNAFFVEGFSDIEQLCLMTFCDDFIISNSTFSWWGAYLSSIDSIAPLIVCPNGNFDGELKKNNNDSDFYPSEWIKYTPTKINLKDTCFTIPVSYDHEDRKQNLKLVMQYLRHYFDTNIFVFEQNIYPSRVHFNKIGADKYHFDTCNEVFHRTKMLNYMAVNSTQEIIFNYDADVLLSPVQILYTIYQLREKDTDFVYPYSGVFARVPRIHYDVLLKHNDLGRLTRYQFKGEGVNDPLSVGGAIAYKRTSFLRAGMENENFISYGAEDVERKIRFERLMFNVKRINGKLYHIDHFIGANSSSRNPHFANNNKEYLKIVALDLIGLCEYINTWPWYKSLNLNEPKL